MNVTREVILDLLPVYLSGEASPHTRALIEEFLKQDPELAKKIRSEWMEKMSAAAPSVLPPDLELKSLRRTRHLLVWQRWLMGFGIFFTAMLLSNQFKTQDGHIVEFHFLLRDYPVELGICLVLGLACWIAYFSLCRRLSTTAR